MREAAAMFAVLLGCAPEGALPADRLPVSTSSAEIPESESVVAVDAAGVRVDGVRVASADDLAVGGSTAALEATLRARAAAIAAEASRDPSRPAFRGAFALEIDRDLDATALSGAIAAAAAAGFGKPWVVVVDERGDRHGIKITLPEIAAAGVAAAAAVGDVAVGGYANPTVSLRPDRGFVVTASDRVVDPGGGLVVPCDPTPCVEWPVVELNRLARRIKLDHPKDRAAIVAPAPGTTVQTVVTTFDALRDDTFAGRGTRELFPEALLSRGTP